MPEGETDGQWQEIIKFYSEGSDLLLNCLAAASLSYRRATLCVPFPTCFQFSNNSRDHSALQQCLDTLPPLLELSTASRENLNLTSLQRALLEWTLASHPRRKASAFQPISLLSFLREVPSARLTGSHASNPSLRPSAVFKLAPHAQPNIADTDGALHGSFEGTYRSQVTAFHGTSFECLHSILRSGLIPASSSNTRLERNGKAFGEGIYLTTELPVAYSFCSGSERWKGSTLAPEGTRLRCILVCGVKKNVPKDKLELVSKKNGDPPPEHYLVIDRPDLITIQYILVYVDHWGSRSSRNVATAAVAGQGVGARSLFSLAAVLVLLIGFFPWWIMPFI